LIFLARYPCFFLVFFMFVIRSRVFRFSNPFHALASVNHFDWQYIFALQEEGLASPENMEMDAALLPNFMESDTYQFLWLILFFWGPPQRNELEYVIGGPKLCWACQRGPTWLLEKHILGEMIHAHVAFTETGSANQQYNNGIMPLQPMDSGRMRRRNWTWVPGPNFYQSVHLYIWMYMYIWQ
jgi:hypothetical protein